MKILFLTDTHFTGKNPASRLDDIQDTIIKKLLDVKDIIQNENIELIIHGGDMFHTPDVSNKFTGEIASIIKSYGVDMYVVPGNHDIFGYNTTTLANTKLGLLAKTGVIKLLDRNNPLVFDDNGFKIGIEGQEYHSHIDEDIAEDFRVTNMAVDFSILVTHAMLLDHKFFDGIKHTMIDDVITSADLVLAGHYHPGFKEREKDGVWFFNPGSLLRVDASTESIKSIPRVVVFDINKTCFNYKYVELPSAKPGKDVFSDKRLTTKMYNNTLETFHNKIKKTNLKGVSILDLIDEYTKVNSEDASIADMAKDMISKIDSEKSCDNGFIPEANTVHITKVEIFNFQAHKHKVVDFVDGLNVIKGESNSGKTAILRAIYWALYDKPSGSDFIKTGAKSCKVIVHLSNGYQIERKRNRSTSGSFNLISPDGTVQEFKGFANNIPVDITNAHQMPEVKINGTGYKVNVASQLDPPFLIGNGPTERITLIGALVDADRADLAKKEFQVEKKRANTEKKQLESLLATKQEELEKYNYLDNMKKNIEVLELAIGKLEGDEVKLQSFKEAKSGYTSSKTNLSFIESRLSSIKIPDMNDINALEEMYNSLEKMIALSNSYEDSLVSIADIEGRINNIPNTDELSKLCTELGEKLSLYEELRKHSQVYSELSNATYEFNHDLDLYNKLIEEYKLNLSKYEELVKLKQTLDMINRMFAENEANNKEIDSKLAKCEEERASIMEQMKDVHEICPHCGSEIDFEKAIKV